MTDRLNFDTIAQTLLEAIADALLEEAANNRAAFPYPRFVWDVTAALRATESALRLHDPHTEIAIDEQGHATARAVCQECRDPSDSTVLASWPCRTVLTITGEIDWAYINWERHQRRVGKTEETVKEEGTK